MKEQRKEEEVERRERDRDRDEQKNLLTHMKKLKTNTEYLIHEKQLSKAMAKLSAVYPQRGSNRRTSLSQGCSRAVL